MEKIFLAGHAGAGAVDWPFSIDAAGNQPNQCAAPSTVSTRARPDQGTRPGHGRGHSHHIAKHRCPRAGLIIADGFQGTPCVLSTGYRAIRAPSPPSYHTTRTFGRSDAAAHGQLLASALQLIPARSKAAQLPPYEAHSSTILDPGSQIPEIDMSAGVAPLRLPACEPHRRWRPGLGGDAC